MIYVYYKVSASTLCTMYTYVRTCDKFLSEVPYMLPLFDKLQYLFRVSSFVIVYVFVYVCVYTLVIHNTW